MADLNYTEQQKQEFRRLGIPVPGEAATKQPPTPQAARQNALSGFLRAGRRQDTAEELQK